MKRMIILLFVSLLSKISSAQEIFSDCIKESFWKNWDSLAKLGKSSLGDWKHCVLEKPMPVFTATAISGEAIELDKLKGKIVIINFWFIDCHPCIAELSGLNKLAEEFKRENIEFLAITWESEKRIYNDFLPKYKLDFIIIPNAQKVIDKVSGTGYPTTYIIDQKGIIKSAWNGGSTGDKAGQEYYERAKPVIDELLKVK